MWWPSYSSQSKFSDDRLRVPSRDHPAPAIADPPPPSSVLGQNTRWPGYSSESECPGDRLRVPSCDHPALATADPPPPESVLGRNTHWPGYPSPLKPVHHLLLTP